MLEALEKTCVPNCYDSMNFSFCRDVIFVICGLVWAPEASGPGKGTKTAISGTDPLFFFPTKVEVRKFSRTYVSVLWPSIDKVFHVDNNFQQSSVVKMPSEEEEAAATRRCSAQSTRQDHLGRCVTCTWHTNVDHVSRLICLTLVVV